MDKVFLRRRKHRRVEVPTTELIALKQYAQKYSYTRSGVLNLISAERIEAYKLQSRWWIVDRPPAL